MFEVLRQIALALLARQVERVYQEGLKTADKLCK